jgi:hypothetical protein
MRPGSISREMAATMTPEPIQASMWPEYIPMAE